MAQRWLPRGRGRLSGGFVTVGVAAVTVLLTATGAGADESGNIEHVESRAGQVHLVYSLPDLPETVEPDLGSVTVTVNEEPARASAVPVGDAGSSESVQRTTILAIDVSNSMRGDRFRQAKQAAKAFLDSVPPDVLVGVTTFASNVSTEQEPTLDRGRLTDVIDGLALSRQTRLYDGVIEAVDAVGSDGQRSLLVLSDGKDTSDTPVAEVTSRIDKAQVKVDVVALEQSANAREPLEEMAQAGDGTLLEADDPEALVDLFADEAAALANQVQVSADVPSSITESEGTVAVSIEAGGVTYTDSALVTLDPVAAPPSRPGSTPQAVPGPGFAITRDMLLAGIGATGLAMLLLLLTVMGVLDKRKKATLEDRVAAHSRRPDPHQGAGPTGGMPTPGAPSPGVAASAVGVAEKALSSNKGMEVALGGRLEAAGLSLKPAEWLLLHAGIAIGAALCAFMLSGGNPLLIAIFLAAGVVAPWVYLGIKKSRRLKAFDSGLADTLQLMSGSLSAGLSLAQSVDTVVREGTQPIAGEFRRALIEARLGVQIEDALDSVGSRMTSEDFAWIVMAIRIQREVGGNLAELLLKVAGTMREREYLRRQVKSLSAEGRLSGWIIGGLPPAFVAYLSLVNPGYLAPLVEDVRGWFMIVMMCVLMGVGGFWMSRVVKVEV